MDRKRLTVIIVIGALIAASLIGTITYMITRSEGETEETPLDLEPVSTELKTLTHARLSTLSGEDPGAIEQTLRSDIGLWISSSRVNLPDHELTVLSSDIEAIENQIQSDLPVPPAGMDLSQGGKVVNSLLFGGSGSVPLLPAKRVNVELKLLIESEEDDSYIERNISYFSEVIDPKNALEKIFELIENDVNGWSSGLARDMEYMLNTLVRRRTTTGVGARPYQTSLNVLNEGDVELAYNIAVALRIAKWTGQLPNTLVNAVDGLFRDRDMTVPMNPSGYRLWGEAEKSNFESYLQRSSISPEPRRISSIIQAVLDAGHGDSADILMRYLYMDGGLADPLDMNSFLEERNLLNPRQASDVTDPMALTHHPSYPSVNGIETSPLSKLTRDAETYTLTPQLDTVMGYQVLGRDLQVQGISDPRAWFTNADLVKTRTRSSSYTEECDTRCGAIPPPPKPPEHDFRLQWDLDLSGSLSLEGEYSGWSGNVLGEGAMEKRIDLELPLRILTWFDDRPSNDGYDWINLNEGKMIWTEQMTEWEITPEANATEYFDSETFQDLRGGFESLTSIIRASEWALGMDMMDDLAVRRFVQTLSFNALASLGAWNDLTDATEETTKLWNRYLEGADLLAEELEKIYIDGHVMELSYSYTRDRLEVSSELPGGNSATIHLTGVQEGDVEPWARITTSSGSTITLDPLSNDMTVSGTFGGRSVRFGTDDPSQPPEQLTDLVLEGGYLIGSKSIELSTWEVPSPHISSSGGSSEDVMTLSFVISGTDRAQGEEMLNKVQDISVPSGNVSNAALLATLDSIASISDPDVWIGLRMRNSGVDGSAPLTRTLLIRTEEGTSISDLIDYCVHQGEIGSLVWGAHPDPMAKRYGSDDTEAEFILIETTPAWAVNLPADIPGSDVLTTSYRNTGTESSMMNTFSLEGAERNPYHSSSSGWGLREWEDLTPLW